MSILLGSDVVVESNVEAMNSNRIRWYVFTAVASANGTFVRANFIDPKDGQQLKFAIYEDASDGNLLASTTPATTSVGLEQDFPFEASVALTEGVTYRLAVISSNFHSFAASDGTTSRQENDGTAMDYVDPFPATLMGISASGSSRRVPAIRVMGAAAPTATLSGNLQPDTTFTITSSGLTPPASVSITDSANNAITVPVTTVGDTSAGTMPALPVTDSEQGLLFGAVSVNFAGEMLAAQYLPPTGLTLTTVAAGYDPYLTQQWTTKPVAGDQFLHDATQFSLTSALVAETEQVGQFDLWYINQSGQNFALYLSSENLQAVGDGSVPGGTVTIGQSLNPRRLGNRKSARQAVNKATYQAIYRS